jgi:dihydropyrimidinase
MTTIIKNGTIVTADLTYKADVKIEGGRITEIGPGLTGGTVLDATGCYVMPGGIDPHTHLEMPFMGTYSADDFDSGTRAALAGGTTMVVDFALPAPGRGCWTRCRCGTTSRAGRIAITPITWRSPGGASRSSTR